MSYIDRKVFLERRIKKGENKIKNMKKKLERNTSSEVVARLTGKYNDWMRSYGSHEHNILHPNRINELNQSITIWEKKIEVAKEALTNYIQGEPNDYRK